MPFIKELWNNITSFYKNWHKKIKWFSIFIKPNKCQKKRKEIKEENPTWTYPRPGTMWPGPAAQQASPVQLPGASSSSCQ